MTKKEARNFFMARREELSPAQLITLNQMIENQLFNYFGWKNKTIATFLSIKDKKEVDTEAINNRLLQKNKLVASVSNFSDNTMLFYPYDELSDTLINKWGIPEPKPTIPFDPKQIDIVLTPLLGFDDNGFRVGYGKGFYDRFVQELKPEAILVGLSFFESIPYLIDIDRWDKKMNYCITPNNIHTF